MPATRFGPLLDARSILMGVVALAAIWARAGVPAPPVDDGSDLLLASPPLPGLADHDPATCPGCRTFEAARSATADEGSSPPAPRARHWP